MNGGVVGKKTLHQWVIADPSVSSSDSTSCDIGGFRLNSCIGIIAEAVIKLYSLTANFMCGYLFKELITGQSLGNS
jgi:hypothetical protein